MGVEKTGRVEAWFLALDGFLADCDRSAKLAAQGLRRCKKAALSGDLRTLERAIADTDRTARQCTEAVSKLVNLDFNVVRGELTTSSYIEELGRTAVSSGLAARVVDAALLSYPYRVIVNPPNSVRLGNKIVPAIRPSAVVETLKRAQRERSVAPGPAFIQALEMAYLFITGGRDGEAVQLSRVYEVVVMAPQARKNYGEYDFVCDLNALDRGGQTVTANKRRLSFPKSTATYGDKGFQFVNPDGRPIVYSSLRFDPDT